MYADFAKTHFLKDYQLQIGEENEIQIVIVVHISYAFL